MSVCRIYTLRDVEEEITAIGMTTIPDRIRTKVNAGNCRCETENPLDI